MPQARFNDSDRYLSLPEVALTLGVSRSTAKKIIKEGDVDSWKIGRTVRISRNSLFEYLHDHPYQEIFAKVVDRLP